MYIYIYVYIHVHTREPIHVHAHVHAHVQAHPRPPAPRPRAVYMHSRSRSPVLGARPHRRARYNRANTALSRIKRVLARATNSRSLGRANVGREHSPARTLRRRDSAKLQTGAEHGGHSTSGRRILAAQSVSGSLPTPSAIARGAGIGRGHGEIRVRLADAAQQTAWAGSRTAAARGGRSHDRARGRRCACALRPMRLAHAPRGNATRHVRVDKPTRMSRLAANANARQRADRRTGDAVACPPAFPAAPQAPVSRAPRAGSMQQERALFGSDVLRPGASEQGACDAQWTRARAGRASTHLACRLWVLLGGARSF